MTKRTIVLAACAALLAACSSGPPSEPIAVTFKNAPCGTGGTVSMSVNTATRVDCSNGGSTITFAGNGASYLIVAEFPTDQVANNFVGYTLASGTLASGSASMNLLRAARRFGSATPAGMTAGIGQGARAEIQGPSAIRPGARQRAADGLLRGRNRRMASAGAFRAQSAVFSTRKTLSAGSITVPAAGSARTFQVLSTFSATAPPAWKPVTATLAYVGASVLLYIDTQAPANGFTGAQLTSYGQYFDQVLYPIDTAAFGPPTDVDQNGHIIMLMSPVVNADTPLSQCQNGGGYVAGFFDGEDFDGPSDVNSNQGEIFYSIVPDPTGLYSCAHTVADVQFDVPATFLHELQHLISFSQHVIVHGGNSEVGSEDEGMSIVAEELGSLYYENKCPPPACRTSPTQIFPDSSQGFVADFMYDGYQYALLPDTASVTLHCDCDDGFSWRGGDWLLMRWLGDQFGAGIWKKLDQGLTTGVANIVSATGQSFSSLFANFGLALYTDSLPGLPRTTAPSADRFVTRNVRQLWARENATDPTDAPYVSPIAPYPVTADTTSSILSPGAISFYRLDTPSTSPTVTIEFAQPGGAALLSVLNPQLAIYRLPPGQ
jgi:hypothetical protein